MTLLFYRRGGLGDTLLTFPVLENLKKMGKYIVVVGNTDYLEIAKSVGWADEVTSEIPNDWNDEKLFISVDGHIKPFPERREWVVDYYLRSANLSLTFSKRLPLKPVDKSPFDGKAVLHPSSGSWKKNPPVELFLRIERFLKSLGLDVIYFLGPADQWLKDVVKSYWESYRPLEVARNLTRAKVFVGLDSGISHLASYCGVLSYMFFGPSDRVVWRPVGERVKIISLDFDCSPCFPNVCKSRDCLDADKLFERFVYNFK